LFPGEFRIDGKGQGLLRSLLGMGECTFLISQVAVALLQVEGKGIIDIGTNPFLGEEPPEFIPLGNPDDILVIDMSVVVLNIGDLYAEGLIMYLLEEVIVISGVLPSLLRPFFQIAEFHQKDGGLQGIQPAINPDALIVIFGRGAMHSEES